MIQYEYTKSWKVYQKGLGEFTDFILIRITIIPYHYVQYICKWFMVQVSVGIDLVTIGFIGLLSVHHMLNCILTFIS